MNMSSLFEFIIRIEKAYDNYTKKLRDEYKLSKTSFDIIMFLGNNPSLHSAKDVSRMKNIKPNVVSLHVDELVRDGYLNRELIQSDRRSYKLILLDKSKKLIEEGRKYQLDFYRSLVNGLTSEDLEHYHRCFKTMYDNATLLQEE